MGELYIRRVHIIANIRTLQALIDIDNLSTSWKRVLAVQEIAA
jgi:hypothetical protein